MKLYKTYSDLWKKGRVIEQKKMALKPLILPYVKRRGGQAKFEFGTFSLQEIPDWRYSPTVKDLEDKLNDLKAQEREAGIAEYHSVKTLRYSPK